MAKDPAFLFYPGDWLGGTMGFSRHEKGAYIDLLMCQFNNGHMDSHMVETILGEKDFLDLWDRRLRKKFSIDNDGNFYNEKLENEVIKRKNYTQSRKNNLLHMNTDKVTHMDGHMENGNENINTVETKKSKNGKHFINFKAQGEEVLAKGYLERLAEADRQREKNSGSKT